MSDHGVPSKETEGQAGKEAAAEKFESLYAAWSQAADSIDALERQVVLQRALVDADLVTVYHYANRARADGLCGKTDFQKGVQDLQRRRKLEVKQLARTARLAKPTDDILLYRVLDQFGHLVFGLGEFRHYMDGVHHPVPEMLVRKCALEVVEASKQEGVEPTANRVHSVVTMLRDKVSIPPEQFDRDPDLVGFGNGVLHIPSGTLRPHSRDYWLTSALPYDYDPAAKAPHFEYALMSSIPEAAPLFQEYAGYGFTTDCSFEVALWLFGLGGSGKSTLVGALQSALGPKAGVLGLAQIEQSRFAFSGLAGRTLMVAMEQPGGYIKALYVLNSLISGEPILVEKKFTDPYTMVPHVKLLWSMNELPLVTSAASGLFRRIRVIRFPPRPEAERDTKLKGLVSQELPGIAAWALRGLSRLRERGCFQIPDCVKEATLDFTRQNDRAGLFVGEECIQGKCFKSQSGPLYLAYRGWCTANGIQPVSSVRLAADWERLGFTRFRSNGSAYWRGVAVINGDIERFLGEQCNCGWEHAEQLGSLHSAYQGWLKVRQPQAMGTSEAAFEGKLTALGLEIDQVRKIVRGVSLDDGILQ